MNDSWIALVDKTGLRRLELELPHTLRFIQRQARLRNAECFWVVLTPHDATLVKQHLLTGDSRAALGMLQHLALHVGAITPPEYDNCPVVQNT